MKCSWLYTSRQVCRLRLGVGRWSSGLLPIRLQLFLWLCLLACGCSTPADQAALRDDAIEGEDLRLFEPRPIGLPFDTPPKISHVQAFDLDADGWQDLIACDCENHTVSWVRQTAPGEFQENVLCDGLLAPAHADCVDFDGDGDIDIAVGLLGVLFPNNDKLGSVVILENDGQQSFTPREILSDVARVSDVRAGDLDEDGDVDLVVTHFGYHQGEVRWMENLGDWSFENHVLQELPGGIHGVIHDMDHDGHLDIVVLISQDSEEVYLFSGDGRGEFKQELLYAANNTEYGSSGLWVEDLDQDGDPDILFTNGDAYDYSPPHPWPWHGVQWLENQASRGFLYHRITSFGGAVCAQPRDCDGDGDVDIFVSSAFNAWDDPSAQSLILLRNNGDMSFTKHGLSNTPSHIQTIAVEDFDKDGVIDLVSGGMHVAEPYDRVQRLMYWQGIRQESEQPRLNSN